MENEFIIHQLKAIAAATSDIERQNNEVKNALCVLLGYLKADYDFNIPTEGGALLEQSNTDKEATDILEFTQKELSKMPKQFKNLFKTNGVRAHIRKRIRNNSVDYEIRYRGNGYNISASGLTVVEAKAKFIKKLQEYKNGYTPALPNVPTTFDKFALYYFENFRKRKVTPATYEKDVLRLKTHLIPKFGNIKLKDITPPLCQQLIDKLMSEGKGKTAEDVFSLLNCTFKVAIKHNIIHNNPLDIVIHEKHNRKHGKALTMDEEKYLFQEAVEPFRTIFAVLLYAGLRPNEYATVRIIGNMIHAKNSKRHNGKIEIKRIPITPMLEPFIKDVTELPSENIQNFRRAFNKIFGKNHKLYDLRTTFYTRCQMFDVAPAARDEFVGHSSGELTNTYTDLPDDYLIKEGLKLNY